MRFHRSRDVLLSPLNTHELISIHWLSSYPKLVVSITLYWPASIRRDLNQHSRNHLSNHHWGDTTTPILYFPPPPRRRGKFTNKFSLSHSTATWMICGHRRQRGSLNKVQYCRDDQQVNFALSRLFDRWVARAPLRITASTVQIQLTWGLSF